MKSSLWIVVLASLFALAAARGQEIRAPQPGTPLRQTILDDLRNAEPTASMQKDKKQKIVFQKVVVRVTGDWAWVSVAPVTQDGKWSGEPLTGLMHHTGGRWKVVEYIGGEVSSSSNPEAAYQTWRTALLKKNPDCPAILVPRKG